MSSNPPQEQPQPLLTSSSSPSSTTAFVAHGDALDDFLISFWKRQVATAENDPPHYGKHPPLPLARIKKVMKADPDVRMIASDAPVLFCKACEIFIQELTCRAFLVADAHKRRTISKSDIARALSRSDHFDFLIDIVPRDETERNKAARVAASIPAGTHARKSSTSGSSGRVNPSGRAGSGHSATANGNGGPDSGPSGGPINPMGLPPVAGPPPAMHRRPSVSATNATQLSTSPTSMGPPPQFLNRSYTQPHINDGVHRHGNMSMTSHRPSHPQLSMSYAHTHIPPPHQHQQTPTPTSASSDHQHFPQTPHHFPPHYSHSHSYPPPHGPITSPTTHAHAHPYGRPRHSNSDPTPMMRYGTAPPPPGPPPFGYGGAIGDGAYGERKPSISPTTGAVEGLSGDATMQDAGC